MYSCAPYATASGFVELPYLFVQSAVFMPIVYWLIGFEANAAKFFFFWLVFLMALTLNTFLGQLLVIVTPSQQLGQLLGSGVLAASHTLPMVFFLCTSSCQVAQICCSNQYLTCCSQVLLSFVFSSLNMLERHGMNLLLR